VSDRRLAGRAWLIWGTAVVVYVVAVFHRCTLGVAGLEAASRFAVGPAALGAFTVLQVLVYAAMQIPTGLLVDRFGPRAVLAVASVFMGFGQVLFAVADSFVVGLFARAVLGLGDALTFVSLLRLVAAHFPARRFAVVVTLTAALGSIGNVLATVPLTLLLGSIGWTATFLIAGIGTAAYAAIVLLRVRDVPTGSVSTPSEPVVLSSVVAQVRAAWRVPGTRLGFWVHFSTMFAPAVLGLLWGFPYLVDAHAFTESSASALLGLMVLVAMVAAPPMGALISRRPEWRMPMVGAYLVLDILVWTVLLTAPSPLPAWLLTVAFGLLAIGLPVSAIGFAIVRDYNPLHRVGTATGVVNVGGFCATTIAAFGVGVVLDQVGPLATATGFRIAFCVVAGTLVIGAWRTIVWWHRARAAVFQAEARGEDVPVRLRHRRWDADVIPAAA
jgi:MFS family permease